MSSDTVCFGNCRQKGKNYQRKGNIRPNLVPGTWPVKPKSYFLGHSRQRISPWLCPSQRWWFMQERRCLDAASWGEQQQPELHYLCCSRVFFQNGYISGLSGRFQLCSLLFLNSEWFVCIGNTTTRNLNIGLLGELVMQSLCGKRSRNLIY